VPYEETTAKKKSAMEKSAPIHYNYREYLGYSAFSFATYRKNFLSVALQANSIKKHNANFPKFFLRWKVLTST
jgi:hypothetical protein